MRGHRDETPRFTLGKVKHKTTGDECEVIKVHGFGKTMGLRATLRDENGVPFDGKRPEMWERVVKAVKG